MKRVDPHNRRLPKSNKPGIPPPTAQEETESKIRREIAIMKKCTHQNLVHLLEVIDDPASKKVYLGTCFHLLLTLLSIILASIFSRTQSWKI